MTGFILLLIALVCQMQGSALPLLYEKNTGRPETEREREFITWAKRCVQQAGQLNSKLDGNIAESKMSIRWRRDTLPLFHPLVSLDKFPLYHLLNQLGSLDGLRHLHIGLLAGDSLIAYLYRNGGKRPIVTCVEWFQECSQEIFWRNLKLNIDGAPVKVIEGDCFSIDLNQIDGPIDLYFYDADHSLLGHKKAILYYKKVLANPFILIIDDWNVPLIRKMTFKGFEKADFQVLYQDYLLDPNGESSQYIAVIRKQTGRG